MAEQERPDWNWTVLVIGEAGQPSRRYLINHRALAVLLIAMLLGAGGIGYVLGSGGGSGARAAVASIAGSDSSATPPPAVAPVVAAQPPAAEPPPSPPSETQPVNAPPERSKQAGEEGETLLLLRNASSEDTIEIQPFQADGSPRASAFQSLEKAMACGDGHHQAPDPALVRVLLAAQHEFGKPLALLGGRCARHDDHPESIEHHRGGRAADVRLRGVSSEQLMDWLVKRGAGGAGRYKHRGGFVHIDVRAGSFAQWEGAEPAPPKVIKAEEAAGPSPSETPAPETPAAPDSLE